MMNLLAFVLVFNILGSLSHPARQHLSLTLSRATPAVTETGRFLLRARDVHGES